MPASGSPTHIVAMQRPSSAHITEASVVCPLCLAGATACAAPGALAATAPRQRAWSALTQYYRSVFTW